jgi:hypothetical protein
MQGQSFKLAVQYINIVEAEFLDEIQTKVSRVFLLDTHRQLYSFAWRFIFLQTHSISYIFLQTQATKHGKGNFLRIVL